jgi:flagellar hook-associated protein 1 FlgK
MSADLLAIARSGTRAARAALDVTAQNIANASSEGYVRRSVQLSEVSTSGSVGGVGTNTLAGVRVSGIARNADVFRQIEVRRTGADASKATAEVQGLENVESAVEQSGLYEASVSFEGQLQQLTSDPTDGSLRAAVVEGARTLANTFNVTATSLDAAGKGLRFEAQDGVDQVNLLAGELTRVNARLSRATDASADQSTLLDQRDVLLQKISAQADITTTFSSDNTVEVRLGGSTGPQLVSGQSANPLAMATATDGTISFTLGGAAIAPASGALAGKGQALVQLAETRGRVDATAAKFIQVVNAAQTSGVDLDGNAGEPLFSGTNAGDMALAVSDGSKLATAPAGSPANSREGGNLASLRTALSTANPSGDLDAALFDISSAVAGRTVTRDALVSIANTATISLQSQAGVDLDSEAVNLVRFQQAFSASGRVMQVANDLFDTILGIR